MKIPKTPYDKWLETNLPNAEDNPTYGEVFRLQRAWLDGYRKGKCDTELLATVSKENNYDNLREESKSID